MTASALTQNIQQSGRSWQGGPRTTRLRPAYLISLTPRADAVLRCAQLITLEHLLRLLLRLCGFDGLIFDHWVAHKLDLHPGTDSNSDKVTPLVREPRVVRHDETTHRL